MAAIDPEMTRLAREYTDSASRLEHAQKTITQRFYAGQDAVFFGVEPPPEVGPPGRTNRSDLLFNCEDPVTVATQLNAIYDTAIEVRKAADLSVAQAKHDAAETALKTYKAAVTK